MTLMTRMKIIAKTIQKSRIASSEELRGGQERPFFLNDEKPLRT
jgi:hypothetical protein